MPDLKSTDSNDPEKTTSSRTPRGVFLVGFMGAGKTTVGRLLAARLGWSFADLDDHVVAAEGRTVAEIFRDSGEDHFRKAETAALGRVIAAMQTGGWVVALGGGAFVQPQNVSLIRETGVPVFFLDATVEELFDRCAAAEGVRPLVRDQNQFRQLYESRRGGYMKADLRLDTQGRNPGEIAEELALRLGVLS